jgi:hypothetical protein
VPQQDTPSIKTAWANTWKIKADRLKIIIGSVIILSIITALPIFFGHIEKRQGVVLHDWVLEHIPPHNVSIIIFIIIWGMALLILYRALYKPNIYTLYCWSLILVCIMRIISISIFALNPPVGFIPLADPLTGVFYGQAIITKDLFFSGHIATVTLIFLCLEKKPDKIIGFISIIAIAVLLVVQHIHYTIDILASPIVTYACYLFTRRFIV